nr:rab GTPase-binding effector protein 1 [Onthophagus taurus]
MGDVNHSSDSKDNDIDEKIRSLENEKKKIRDEFDSQRAKMKELFLQKEDELQRKILENNQLLLDLEKNKSALDEIKSQLCVANLQLESKVEVEKRKAAEEIASLQQLVHETVEESSSSKSIFNSEVGKLRSLIEHLQRDNYELRSELHNTQEQSSLAPGLVLSAVTKKLKKFGADAFTTQDNSEEIKIREEEDVELLKSLVVPLEEEIKALKVKLRATDEQLQKCIQCGHFNDAQESGSKVDSSLQEDAKLTVQCMSTNTSFEAVKSGDGICDMCSNYEAQLVKEQQLCSELKGKVVAAEKAAERHREDLLKEIGFRKDMEEKWNEKKEEHRKQVAELTCRTECAEQDLKELQQTFKQTCDDIGVNLRGLKSDRETIQQELEKLQNENDHLIGKYSVHSQQLQSEIINLPNTVQELHEHILNSHQDLIIAKIGKEEVENKAYALQSDIVIKESIITSLKKDLSMAQQEIEHLTTNQVELMLKSKQAEKKCEEIQQKLYLDKEICEKLESAKKSLEDQNSELKTQISSLQQELDTSETVQKDFVRLSQSLQVQLEKIRDSDTQVRWQHDEDVDECPMCRVAFSASKRKQHCRHCGQIFCVTCLVRSVPSGPNQRPSKVCDVCHTLLVKSSAPYFSTEAPHSPD